MLAKNEDYSSILYQLLDAQERLNFAEVNFSTSELTYNLSLYQLKKVKGSLLTDSKVQVEEKEEDGLPLNLPSIGLLHLSFVDITPIDLPPNSLRNGNLEMVDESIIQ